MEESGASVTSRRRPSSTVTNSSTCGSSSSSSSKEEGSCAGLSSWIPYGKAFLLFAPPVQPSTAGTPLASGNKPGMIARRPLVERLTKEIVKTYQLCNPSFNYSEALNPKRFLTSPSTGLLNDGYDNENSDLILYVNLVLLNQDANRRYVVKDLLGQGTFGQVAKCCDPETNSYFAVKIIKNQPAYSQQALVEVSLLYMLNRRFDPDDRHHVVRILDHFTFKNHLCISFEILGSNLFELIKMNSFKGLSLSIVQIFSKQILQALVLMKDAGIIHCDLKPENILISKSTNPTEIKVIDFGSACMEGRTIYSYIQSRYYRSPEVLLGYPYTTSIDMWSFGCIVAELFLGLPLFPGASEYDLLKRMIEILGRQPPDYLLRDAKNTKKFFKHAGGFYHPENDGSAQENSSAYRVLTEEEFEARESKRPIIGKRYFNNLKLEDIIANYPYRKSLSKEEILKEKLSRLALVDFLRGLVELDPGKRWSPLQASGHPFVTGEPFRCPYHPPPETPQIPVIHTVTVEHNPGGGHWLAAGLSLQVSNVNKPLHNSPHFQKVPMSFGSSYGSLGSHGSYNDNYGLSSSYGSYGDFNSSLHSYYSSAGPGGFNPHMQVGGPFLGFSPDARHMFQRSHGNGFGTSPGGLRPLSLGASPQFTPPNSQIPISSASSGKHGPTSPSRSGAYGVSLGKAAAVGQYNKSRHWAQPIMGMQPYESFQHGSVHCDGISVSYPDAQHQMQFGPQNIKTSGHSNWKQQMGGRNGVSSSFSSTNYKSSPAPRENVSNLVMANASDELSDKPESSSPMPDPADWDPNYSDESLLQEDNPDLSLLETEFANAVHISCTRNSAIQHSGFGRSRLPSSSFIPVNQRTYGSVHAHSLGELIPPSAHDTHVRPPHFPQKFPSRFSQQFDQQSNHNKFPDIHRGNHHQSSQPSHNMADSHSSTNVMFASSLPWGGGRVGHSLTTTTTTTLPTCHPRQDCGRL